MRRFPMLPCAALLAVAALAEPVREPAVVDGVTFVHRLATRGDGSAAAPWSGWDERLPLEDGAVLRLVGGHFRGHFDLTGRDGVVLEGIGTAGSVLECERAQGDCVVVDTSAARGAGSRFTIRELTVRQVERPLETGRAVLRIAFVHRLELDNVHVECGPRCVAGVALAVKEFNLLHAEGLDVSGGEDATPVGVGLDLANGATANRGNAVVESGLFNRCQIGIRVAQGAASLVNSLHFDGVKHVRSGARGAGGIAGSVAYDLYTQAEAVTISNGHCERYETCVRADGVDALSVTGTSMMEFRNDESSSAQIVVRGAMMGGDFSYNRFSNSDALGAGKSTAFAFEAGSAVQGVRIAGNKFKNVATRVARAGQGLVVDASGETGAAAVAVAVAPFVLYLPRGIAPGDDVDSIWRAPAPVRVLAAWCEADDPAATIDLKRDDGSPRSLLRGKCRCDGSSCAVAGAEADLEAGARIDFDAVAPGKARRISVMLEYANR